MPEIILGAATLKPTKSFSKVLKHSGDVSENDKAYLIAQRIIFGKKCKFYSDGTRLVEGMPEEFAQGDLMKLTHASILTNIPCGHKGFIYVDATNNEFKLWMYNKRIRTLMDAVEAMQCQQCPTG